MVNKTIYWSFLDARAKENVILSLGGCTWLVYETLTSAYLRTAACSFFAMTTGKLLPWTSVGYISDQWPTLIKPTLRNAWVLHIPACTDCKINYRIPSRITGQIVGLVETLWSNKDAFVIQLLVCESALDQVNAYEMWSSFGRHSENVRTTLFKEVDQAKTTFSILHMKSDLCHWWWLSDAHHIVDVTAICSMGNHQGVWQEWQTSVLQPCIHHRLRRRLPIWISRALFLQGMNVWKHNFTQNGLLHGLATAVLLVGIPDVASAWCSCHACWKRLLDVKLSW